MDLSKRELLTIKNALHIYSAYLKSFPFLIPDRKFLKNEVDNSLILSKKVEEYYVNISSKNEEGS